MSFSITLTGDTVADLRTQAAVLLNLSEGAVTHVAETARPAPTTGETPKPATTRKKAEPKDKPAAEPPKELPEDSVEDLGTALEEQAKAEPITNSDVIERGKQLAAAKGIDALRAMLTEFEAERISKIPEAKWPEWMARCKAAIKA